MTDLRLAVVLDNLRTPENVGSIFRSADAFGVQELFLLGDTPTPANTKVRRSARSTEKSLDYEHFDDTNTLLNRINSRGYLLVALEISPTSIPLTEFNANQPICVILGNERRGVSVNLLQAASASIHIPMRGQNTSMNVAVAAGIALYELSQQFN